MTAMIVRKMAPGQGQPGHDEIQELGGRLAGAHSGDVAAVLLQVVGDLDRLEHDRDPEIAEEEDQDRVARVVGPVAAQQVL